MKISRNSFWPTSSRGIHLKYAKKELTWIVFGVEFVEAVEPIKLKGLKREFMALRVPVGMDIEHVHGEIVGGDAHLLKNFVHCHLFAILKSAIMNNDSG